MADEWDQFQDAPAQGGDPWAQFQDADAPPVASQPAQAGPQRPTGDALDAILEPIMSLGSSTIATPVAGLAGIGAAGTRALGLTEADPADVVRGVQGAMTYQPRTTAGQVATNVVAYPFEKLAQGADWAGQKTLDMTGSPVAATAVNTAIQALAPVGVVRGVKGVKVRPDVNRGTAPVGTPVAKGEVAPAAKPAEAPKRAAGLEGIPREVPTLEQLTELRQQAYKRADEAGIVVRENSLTGLKARIVALTKKEGINSKLHPDSAAALQEIIKSKGNLKLSEVETLRKIASDAKGSIKPADQRIAGKIVDELDDYLDNLADADVIAGDATKAKALKEARDLYSREKKAQTINHLVERAKLSAPNFSASGLENALRTEFRNLAKNERQIRRFTKEEQAAIRRVATGGPIENAFRFIGKFAPTGVVSGTLGGGLAVSLMGPAGIGVPAAGLAGRYVANRLTMRNVNAAEELMRRGPAQANALARQQAEQRRNALADF